MFVISDTASIFDVRFVAIEVVITKIIVIWYVGW